MSTINRHDATTRLPYTSRLDPSQIMHMTLNTIMNLWILLANLIHDGCVYIVDATNPKPTK